MDYKNESDCTFKHITTLIIDVIDDKPEGFIMYKHEPVGRGFIHHHIDHERVYAL